MKESYKKITTWEQFCKASKTNPKLPDFSTFPEEDRAHMAADYQLARIIKFFNEGVIPDYTPGNNQKKYEPYFYVVKDSSKPSGFALSSGGYGLAYDYSFVGLRFAFLDYDSMRHVTLHFISLYEKKIGIVPVKK